METNVKAHDAFFKNVLSRKQSFIALMKHFFPEQFAKIDLGNLKLKNTSFTDRNLKQHFSDLTYETKIKNIDTYISLLIEHKSLPDNEVAFQIFTYIDNIWQQDKKQKKKRSFVLPILIYHGEEDWTPKTLKEVFGDIPREFLQYLPDYQIAFLNINKIPDKELANLRDDAYLLFWIFMVKNIYEQPERLLENFADFISKTVKIYSEPDLRRALHLSLQYLSNFRKFEKPEFKNKLMETFETTYKTKDGFEILPNSIIGDWLQQGRKEGKLEDAYRMYKAGFDLQLISDITELTVDEIISYINSRKNGK